MRFLVDEINKIIFGWNAKAGCSHIKNLFYYLTDTQPFTNIHRQVADKSLPDDYIKYTIIIITRNPYERIVSGFIEKYVSGKIRLPKQFSQDTITFNQFTKDILDNSFKNIDYLHFTKQLSDKWNDNLIHLMVKYYDINYIDYEYISSLYHGKPIPDEVKKYRGDSYTVYKESYEKNVSNESCSVYKGKKVPTQFFYNDEIKKRVYKIYQKDFIYLESIGIKYDFGITLVNQEYMDIITLMNKFTFIPGKDQMCCDLFRLDPKLSLRNKLLEALSCQECKGINTLGFMKNKIDNLKNTPHIYGNFNGIYIKKD